MTFNPKAKFWGGVTLVCIGVLIALSEVAVHIYGKVTGKMFDTGHVDLLIALVFGFVGMYVLSPKGAKDGGQFLVNSTVRVIQVIRSGRRRSDPVAAVLEDELGHTATIEVPHLTDKEIPIEAERDATKPHRRATDRNLDKGGPHA